jgi:hypothetical protein
LVGTGHDDDAVATDPGRSYAELLAETDALRRENARLRGLLGLDGRADDGHAVTWAPTLLTQPSSQVAVDSSAPLAAKVALLRSLFGARADVYAVRWQSASSGKSGWQPATKGGWSKRRSTRDLSPLTDAVLAAHLAGRETVGIYPLLRGDQCALVVCDFDGGTWALDALACLDACHASGVPAVLERSRSGTEHMCGCSSTGSSPRPRPGRWVPRSCGRR